jgi:hypothetical protein
MLLHEKREDPETGAWLKTSSNSVALGLNLVPFAGIADAGNPWAKQALDDLLGNGR